jgi:hypothetical protein
LLIPLRSGRFRIVVDPTPAAGWGGLTDDQQAILARHRTRFRVAHELAHTFFYRTSGGRPTRLFPAGSDVEEQFADEFARSLLAPGPVSQASAREILHLQAEWDVSLEVAARACAGAAPGPKAVGLWRWSIDPGGSERVYAQWSSDAGVAGMLVGKEIVTRAELETAFAAAARRYTGLSVAIIEERQQALAVLDSAGT